MSATNEPIGRSSPFEHETTVPITPTDIGAHCAESLGSDLLARMKRHAAWMQPHQKAREQGGLFLEAIKEIERLTDENDALKYSDRVHASARQGAIARDNSPNT